MENAVMAEQTSREAKYRKLMGEAERISTAKAVVMAPTLPADAYFFPWEQSQHHANGSTSAEKDK